MWNPFSKVKLTAEEKALPEEERKALIKSKKLQAHYDKELERAQEREQERVEKIEEKKRDVVYRDTVIYAIGQAPRREGLDELRFCAPVFRAIGDCVAPRNIRWATAEAFAAARDIGR